MRTIAVAATFVLSSAPAWAGEGDACQVTADCDRSLHCIEGRCVGAEHLNVRDVHEAHARSSVWFGNGQGYVVPIVICDTIASITAATFVAFAFGTSTGAWAIAALFPTTLVGPIIHAVNGRPAAAAISFFAWASVPPTSIGSAALTGLGTYNIATATFTGSVVAGAFAIGLGTLDAYMARDMKKAPRASSFQVMPSIAPTRDGLSMSLAGTF
jgi:hypothetical protein